MIKKHAFDTFLMPVQRCMNGEDVNNLPDHELLAIVLGTGTKYSDVFELSSVMLREFGGLAGLVTSGIREIARNKGIGLKKAIRIHAAFEMGRRVITAPVLRSSVNSPRMVWNLLLPDMAGSQKEEFWVLVLNNKNHLLKKSIISMGTVSEAIVHPREVFRDAIREGGSAIIIAHNHPSGSTEPSKEDIETSKRIAESGRIIGIPLLDHVIISDSSYLSLKEGGYL